MRYIYIFVYYTYFLYLRFFWQQALWFLYIGRYRSNLTTPRLHHVRELRSSTADNGVVIYELNRSDK